MSYKEIMDEIENIDLGPEQIEKIYEVLESMGIEVLGDAPDHDVEEDEELDLTVPEGIADGDYKLWVHNGHGGAYGWSNGLDIKVQKKAENPFTFGAE